MANGSQLLLRAAPLPVIQMADFGSSCPTCFPYGKGRLSTGGRPEQQQIMVPGAKKALAQLHARDLCATHGLSSTSNV
jgi:hypothetical protein